MPFQVTIDREKRRVIARGHGTLDPPDVLGYHRTTWSDRSLRGFDELIDMSAVEHVIESSADRMRELAGAAATIDLPEGSARLAIYAPSDLTYGLGRMYQAFRDLDERSTKSVGVFRSLDEALAFLDRES